MTLQKYIREVYCKYGLPDNLTSDRDPKFSGLFWKSLCNLLGIKLNMSSSRHPQTDGQSERMIRTLEQYLRNYINFMQNDWEEWLPFAEFAQNNARNTSTGLTPFEIVLGYHPQSTMDATLGISSNPAAEELAKSMDNNVRLAIENLKRAQDRYTKYASKGKRDEIFAVGDKVWISTEFLSTDVSLARPNKALGHKYLGPYAIIKVISPVSYMLDLPYGIKSHPTIHVSNLKRYVKPHKLAPTLQIPDPEIVDGDEEYEVEEIVDTRIRHKHNEYLVRWKGFGDLDMEWLRESDLTHAKDLIIKFQEKHGGKLENIPTGWTDLTYEQLRVACKENGLVVRGSKTDMLDRLKKLPFKWKS